MRRSRTLAALALTGLGLTACGASVTSTQAAPPAAPESTPTDATAPDEELRTLAEAEAALERARTELSAVTLAVPPPAAAGAPAPSTSPPAPAAEAQSAPEGTARSPEPERESADEARADAYRASPCETACKAFGSLVRAKDAVCRLEEPRGARCERAEDVVRDARARVQGCGCPD